MGALKDAVDMVESSNLRSCEKAVNQMVWWMKWIRARCSINISRGCRLETIAQGWYAASRDLIPQMAIIRQWSYWCYKRAWFK